MPWVQCVRCAEKFYAKPRHLKVGWGKYCSNACSYEAKKTGKWVSCNTCKKEVYRCKRELKASKSQHYFCNKSCFAVWKNSHILTGENHVNWKYGENAYRDIMLRAKIPPICYECKIHDIRVLVVHHLDQDRKHNYLENLRWLCRNCHYLTHNRKTF